MATSTVPSPKSGRLFRWFWKGLLLVIALVVVLAVIGASYQAIQNSADSRRFHQEGKSVDVGGHELNIDCTGQGSPTVVLDSGLGVPAMGWNAVQPEIAKFTRVCSYDRAGYGWSDAGPLPRTSAQLAQELHTLLQNAGERPPFVLVGHSFGGFNVRVYNGRYPDQVVGVVLVDASQEDQDQLMPSSFKKFNEQQQRQQKTQELMAPILNGLGISRFMAGREPLPDGVSNDQWREYLYLSLMPKFAQATASELQWFDESARQVHEAGTLADKPLEVLTAGKNLDRKLVPASISQKDLDDLHQLWINDLQLREARLSTRGKRIMVSDSDHMIPFERPDAIATAVREVCDAVKSSAARDQLFPAH